MKTIQFAALIFALGVSTFAAVPVGGDWSGTIKVQNQDLRLVLHVKETAGKLSATFDSPDQFVAGMPVDSIEIKGQQFNFEIKRILCVYSGTLDKDGQTITGSWSQLGTNFPVNFKKGAGKK
jgi:hypothetical protein